MLSEDAVKKFANQYQTSELNVRREYFQHLFLSLFYAQDNMDKVYFKGGTALRLIYGSQRFSEDLDFDSSFTNLAPIENAIIATLAKAQQDGIRTELDDAKKTTGGYLATMRFLTADHTVPLRVELSFRDKEKKGQATIITSNLFPDYTIVQLVQEQLVAGKIAALLSRKKPRDFYDFYFLLRHHMLPSPKKEILGNVLEALQKTDISFERELKEFLAKGHHLIIKNFRQTLTQEIKRYV